MTALPRQLLLSFSAKAQVPRLRPGAVARRPNLLIRALRLATALIVRAWLRAYHGLRLTGQSNLPRAGSFVLVANHASHLDVLCLLAAIPLREMHRVYPTASADYFYATPLRALMSSLLFNGLPFHRRHDDTSPDGRGIRASLETCRALLAGDAVPGGAILILFPEGSRSCDGAVGPFKRGVGLMVAGTGVAVVPCRLEGTFEAMPKGCRFPRPRRIHLSIGTPRHYSNLRPGKAVARHVAQDLYDVVVGLTRRDGGSAPADIPEDQPVANLAA